MSRATFPACRPLASAIIGAALFLSVGGHLALLQGFAWTTMVGKFARVDSLGTAIEKTLSGQHPCGLCKEISKASGATHEKSDSLHAKVKLGEFIDPRTVTAIMAFAKPISYHLLPINRPDDLSFPPPVPVPIPEPA